MRLRLTIFGVFGIIAAGSLLAFSPVIAQAAPYCESGQAARFVFGFAELRSSVGGPMGEPLECEHVNPENGDSLQQTTKGLAFYRKRTNTPTFTNGWEHWALTSKGLVRWTGLSIDPPGTAGRIALVSDKDGNQEIYIVNPDGSGLRRLTNNPAADYFPVWSPDGNKLAFVSERDGSPEYYVVHEDGTALVRLTNADYFPVWSPDSNKLAFVSERDGSPEIYIVNEDGTVLVRLTNAVYSPTWSPDGNKLAFVGERDGNPEIYTVNEDGTGLVRLTNSAAIDFDPAWAPDGTRIAFARTWAPDFQTSEQNTELYVVGAQGGDPLRLTDNTTMDSEPSWSPDGSKIAFMSAVLQSDFSSFQVIDAVTGVELWEGDGFSPAWSTSGSTIVSVRFGCGALMGWSSIVLTNVQSGEGSAVDAGPRSNCQPTWSPDGSFIAFESYEGHDGVDTAPRGFVYLIGIDGKGLQRLIADAAWSPAWSAEPTTVKTTTTPDKHTPASRS